MSDLSEFKAYVRDECEREHGHRLGPWHWAPLYGAPAHEAECKDCDLVIDAGAIGCCCCVGPGHRTAFIACPPDGVRTGSLVPSCTGVGTLPFVLRVGGACCSTANTSVFALALFFAGGIFRECLSTLRDASGSKDAPLCGPAKSVSRSGKLRRCSIACATPIMTKNAPRPVIQVMLLSPNIATAAAAAAKVPNRIKAMDTTPANRSRLLWPQNIFQSTKPYCTPTNAAPVSRYRTKARNIANNTSEALARTHGEG